jgi:cellulose synthase/poly-beta-1,6-N-acetylglucosamine synthase-like glycosyltransferase
MFLYLGVVVLGFSLIPYIIYFFGIHFGKKPVPVSPTRTFPQISIVISAYNEEQVITQRIENIKQCHYPVERYELIFVDDCSNDNTRNLARLSLESSGIDYRIIANPERMGTTRSYNSAIKNAKYPIIVTTDADVFFEPDALNYLIGRLLSDEKIAAVTGELRPIMNTDHTTRLEGVYRSYYGRMCEWESAHESTFNFNGAIVAFRSDLIGRINDKRGADDANTAFEAIRKGYRAVYESRSIVYEVIPRSFETQYRQKTRRATGLIAATLSNLDLLRNKGWFCRFFFPLRIFMFVFSPLLFFIAVILFSLGILLYNPLLLLFLIFIVSGAGILWRNNLIFAFILNQFYLTAGLLYIGKDMRVWESTSDKKGT